MLPADQAQGLEAELGAHEAVLLPLAGLGRGVGVGHLAGDREHQGDRMLGRGDGVAERRVHHHNAMRRRRLQVDIVDADAGAADDLELLCRFEYFGGDLSRRTDGEPVILANDLEQFLLGKPGLHIGFDTAFFENGNCGGGQFVGDQNLDHGF